MDIEGENESKMLDRLHTLEWIQYSALFSMALSSIFALYYFFFYIVSI